MKITFIRPHLNQNRAADAMEPVVFAILAGLTPPDVEIAFYDDRIEPIPFDEPTDLAALTVETYTARRAYQIAGRFRRRGVPVVMGGYHPTCLPQETLQHAEAVVIGDAEQSWPRLLADMRAGRLQRLYHPSSAPPMIKTTPDRSIFRGKRYAPVALVQYSRGCRFACDFCSIHAFYGGTVRHRPVADVVAEIEAAGRKLVVLVDDNLFVSPSQAEELFRALIPLNIRWFCQISLDIAQYPRLLALMAKSGCMAALVGLESLSPANLHQMKKGWNLKQGDYPAVIRAFHDHGIMVCGAFVFGYDHDTPDSLDRTLEFAMRSRLALANFNPLTPTPATRLYARLQAEGRLIYDRWWLDPAFRYGRAMFHPRRMTAAELSAGCFRIRRRFNRYGSMLRRGWANCYSWRQAGVFALANLISRKEIYNKQDAPLGGLPEEEPG